LLPYVRFSFSSVHEEKDRILVSDEVTEQLQFKRRRERHNLRKARIETSPERTITIVTYHFVRDLKRSRFPEIKGLPLHLFREQLEYIKRHYRPIGMEELLAALKDREYPLASNALLLTFDDGYIDHFLNVFPILNEAGIQGCFFPPAKAVEEHEVLDVNKIHFVLASEPDKTRIIESIFAIMDKRREFYSLENNAYYYRVFALANRFDPAEIIFIKRLLQKGLPEPLRREIVDKLFRQYVTEDEKSFSRELYLSRDQLVCMRRNGMFIGSHGYSHSWLDTLDTENQKREIELSLRFLSLLGCDTQEWAISYPYGAFNESLLSVLRARGCRIGFTTEAGIPNLDSQNPLTLSRLDTNDLPKEGDSAPNPWTLKVTGWRDQA
jgi:peptidoglycan/xylan/chitin deacetylase (PgdA/CDA1 family)